MLPQDDYLLDEPIDQTGGALLAVCGFLVIVACGAAGVVATLYYFFAC